METASSGVQNLFSKLNTTLPKKIHFIIVYIFRTLAVLLGIIEMELVTQVTNVLPEVYIQYF
jgi:hypothetical protein